MSLKVVIPRYFYPQIFKLLMKTRDWATNREFEKIQVINILYIEHLKIRIFLILLDT